MPIPIEALIVTLGAACGIGFIARAISETRRERRCKHHVLAGRYCYRCATASFYGEDGFKRCEHGVIGGNACAKCIDQIDRTTRMLERVAGAILR